MSEEKTANKDQLGASAMNNLSNGIPHQKITDEPHQIRNCFGTDFVIFDALDCRVTINGEGAKRLADEIVRSFNATPELLEALKVRAFNHGMIVAATIVMRGFDRAEIATEILTSAGIKSIEALNEITTDQFDLDCLTNLVAEAEGRANG